MDLSEVLRTNTHTAELSDAERAAFASALLVTEHPGGHVFIKEGGKGDTLFLVLEGEVVVTRDLPGLSHGLKRLQAGEFFGQLALISHEPCAATCTAVGPVRVASLPATAFSVLFYAQAPLAEALQRAVAVQVMRDFRNVTRQIREELAAESRKD